MELLQKTFYCLLNGELPQPCNHKWCECYAKKPHYFQPYHSTGIAEHTDFTHFKLFNSGYGNWIMAVNPYKEGDKEKSNFEFFRQAKSELEAYGEWPSDRNVFNRSEIKVTFKECMNWNPTYNTVTGERLEDRKYLDLREVAIYIGGGAYNG